ncbi:hypothetical protein [Streptomyces sp. NBC_01104]|uniref:hypothetical protein n=1 Tax=Streptomyces sp. NBC_01104 TaxID=2903750 RepID=UPI00386F872C|nr:hypothetical protein OG450_25655 [Streptomyces sp. NBC_01104]
MNGGSGWENGSAGHRPPGHGPGRTRAGGSGGRGAAVFALARSWVTGAVVHIIAGYVISRGLVDMLATDERLDVFTWRLGLQHVPAVFTTVLAVLAAARVLPEEQRDSRLLYLSAALGAPLAALGYGYAVLWDVSGMEGFLMPVVTLATGAAVGLSVDRLMEDTDPEPVQAAPYFWRDGGAGATDYLGSISVAAGVVAVLAGTGVGG